MLLNARDRVCILARQLRRGSSGRGARPPALPRARGPAREASRNTVRGGGIHLHAGGLAGGRAARARRFSTGERPFVDVLQDARFWVIHVVALPSLFAAGGGAGLAAGARGGGQAGPGGAGAGAGFPILADRFAAGG